MNQQTRIAATTSKLKRELLKSLSKNLRFARARVRFDGLKLTVPLVYGLGADHLSRTERPWTFRLLARLLNERSGAFVDIGANVGLYLIWLKSLDERRAYVGFEPNPACYFYLQELVRCNHFVDANVFPIALSDSRRLRTFFARRLGDKMGSLLADHRVEKEKPFTFNVITEPGDPVFADLELAAISAIKIDVEGFELEVLRGLTGTLAKHRPPIICEVLVPDPERPEYGTRLRKLEDLFALMNELDYSLLSMGPDEQLRTADSPEAMLEISQPDRILIPSGDVDSTLDLWRSANSR